MNTATTRRIAQTTAEDLHRLADQGERNGIRILVDHRTGQHVATSASDPTRCYHVDAERGCTCKGFAYWGRCQHHSLLLSELGLIPDPDPIVTNVVVLDEHPAPCRACRGAGFRRAYTGGGLSDWVAVPCSCTRHAA
ncbi:MAG: hypothetical protein M3Q03_19935 [Chloroflexota bacterium]|nr:hypothetical protein [Chloroflexota bacterium]